MIIVNGFIQPKQKTPSEPVIDPKTGFPQKPEDAEWGKPIECQFSATRYNALGKASGEPYTSQSYEILIEAQPFVAEQIKLHNLAMEAIGEFSVISATPLDAVGQIKILV